MQPSTVNPPIGRGIWRLTRTTRSSIRELLLSPCPIVPKMFHPKAMNESTEMKHVISALVHVANGYPKIFFNGSIIID